MLLKCQICGKEFEAKRRDAKTCSPACRQIFKRNRLNVTDKVKCDSVTDNQTKLVTDNVTDKYGKCEVCGMVIEIDEEFEAKCDQDLLEGFRLLAENKRSAYRCNQVLSHHTIKELEDYNIKNRRKIFIPNWKYREENGYFRKQDD